MKKKLDINLLKNRTLPPEKVSQKDTALTGSNNMKEQEKNNENPSEVKDNSTNEEK